MLIMETASRMKRPFRFLVFPCMILESPFKRHFERCKTVLNRVMWISFGNRKFGNPFSTADLIKTLFNSPEDKQFDSFRGKKFGA